jgi:hypothetical protein
MKNEKYRIAKFYKGKGGYPEKYDFYELQCWNSVYKHWYSINNGFLGIEFVKDYCTIHNLNYNNIPHIFIDKID